MRAGWKRLICGSTFLGSHRGRPSVDFTSPSADRSPVVEFLSQIVETLAFGRVANVQIRPEKVPIVQLTFNQPRLLDQPVLDENRVEEFVGIDAFVAVQSPVLLDGAVLIELGQQFLERVANGGQVLNEEILRFLGDGVDLHGTRLLPVAVRRTREAHGALDVMRPRWKHLKTGGRKEN